MKCPQCGTVWNLNSEQAISVELFDACVSCRRFVMTRSELDKILTVQKERREKYRGTENE